MSSGRGVRAHINSFDVRGCFKGLVDGTLICDCKQRLSLLRGQGSGEMYSSHEVVVGCRCVGLDFRMALVVSDFDTDVKKRNAFPLGIHPKGH